MANNVEYTIFMDSAQVEGLLVQGATGLGAALNRLLFTAGKFVQGEVSAAAPEGVAGAMGEGLKNHIALRLDPELHTAEIGPDDSIPYADAVETGSRPHMPPTDPDGALAQWCDMKGLDLWPVAWSIFHHGTKPHPYIVPTYEKVAPEIPGVISLGIDQYIKRLGVGYVGI